MIFTTKQTGDKGEAYAAKYLKKHKYKIIARNYKKPYGEIDIIAAVSYTHLTLPTTSRV